MSREGLTVLTIEADVTLDGSTVYVNGMALGSVLIAAFPSLDRLDGKPLELGRMQINFEGRGWQPR